MPWWISIIVGSVSVFGYHFFKHLLNKHITNRYLLRGLSLLSCIIAVLPILLVIKFLIGDYVGWE